MLWRMRSRRGSAATVVLVVLVLAGIAGGLWYFVFRSTPEKTVTAMLEAARVEDRKVMEDYLTERSLENPGVVTGLTVRLADRGTAAPEYAVGEPETDGRLATVPVEFPLSDTLSTITGVETFTMPYVLHREGRVWLVDAPDTQQELARQAAGGLMDAFRRFIMPGEVMGEVGERRI